MGAAILPISFLSISIANTGWWLKTLVLTCLTIFTGCTRCWSLPTLKRLVAAKMTTPLYRRIGLDGAYMRYQKGRGLPPKQPCFRTM
ncbi:hypothetical protein V8C42DRAFT_314620 [Trichoderma barbatum]